MAHTSRLRGDQYETAAASKMGSKASPGRGPDQRSEECGLQNQYCTGPAPRGAGPTAASGQAAEECHQASQIRGYHPTQMGLAVIAHSFVG